MTYTINDKFKLVKETCTSIFKSENGMSWKILFVVCFLIFIVFTVKVVRRVFVKNLNREQLINELNELKPHIKNLKEYIKTAEALLSKYENKIIPDNEQGLKFVDIKNKLKQTKNSATSYIDHINDNIVYLPEIYYSEVNEAGQLIDSAEATLTKLTAKLESYKKSK